LRARHAALLAPLLAACSGPGFDYAELPEPRIAVVYRTSEEAERVNEIVRREREDAQPRLPGEKHVRLEDVGTLLGVGTSTEERAAGLLGRMAFVDPHSQAIEVAEFAGRGAQPLDWSPDRRRLLFVSFRREIPHLYEYVLDSGEVRQLTSGDHDDLDGCYGPDGRIAFSRATGPSASRLWLHEPGGGPPRVLTPGPRDLRPSWSPRDDLLVYETMDAAGASRIAAIAPLAGGEPRVLARGRSPAFTPDGAWIVYSATTREGERLWRMRPDGTGRRPLGRSPFDEVDPAVSPDGRFVAYVSIQDDRPRLWVRSMDGTGQRPLVQEEDALLPAW
jgi:Tol biopolymer transport system component